jgi:glycosyltransferase involved in cell wall biosynthesis
VTDIARRRRWTVHADFDDLAAEVGSARLGICPILHGSGIQNKVLEAAAHGLAQVVSPVALRGLDPGFPAVASADDDTLIDHLVSLLDDDALRARLADAQRRHVAERYTVAAWTPWADAVLAEPRPQR